MRHVFLPAFVFVFTAACATPKDKPETAANDHNAPATEPAVIVVPLTVPKPDTQNHAVPVSALIPADSLQRVFVVSPGYALVTAMMIGGDERALDQVYLPVGKLYAPDTTIKGNTGIVRWLIALAHQKSLADFQRTSQGMRVLDDSTLADSGSYVMTLKRSLTNVVYERGKYLTHWRARPDKTQWVIVEDHILPAKNSRK